MWKNTTSTSAPVAGTFDAALRLRSVGTDDIDVELVQRPAELGHAVTPGRPDLVHPERRVLIRVEGDRLAIALQIGARRGKIIKGQFRLCKAQVHQTAGRIIDKDEQGALWAAILEPPVFRAVDLNQLAHTVATMARLVDPFEPLSAILPEPVSQHPARRTVSTPRCSPCRSESFSAANVGPKSP